MDNENKLECTSCNGHGVVTTRGSYYDFEPPTKKCEECEGTGDADIQEWKMSVWRDTVTRSYAMRNVEGV